LDDDEPQAGEEEEAEGGRKRRRPRTQGNMDVPVVRDTVGEGVTDALEKFVKE
jgi:hypothetical protein